MNTNTMIALVDLDAMLHIIANVQLSAGNRDNAEEVKLHVKRFVNHILVNTKCSHAILIYQNIGHENFRNEILPRYKEHRSTSEAIEIWKPTILEAFEECQAVSVDCIESDDAIGVLAKAIGYDKTIVVTSDKDMKQIPTLIYNPFKQTQNPEERWTPALSEFSVEKFLMQQVLTGDPTDMPGDLCGIEKVGPKTAEKILDNCGDFFEAVGKAYIDKYGEEEGFKRCKLTYQMVKILDDRAPYLNVPAGNEVDFLKKAWPQLVVEIKDESSTLFEDPKTEDIKNLFL